MTYGKTSLMRESGGRMPGLNLRPEDNLHLPIVCSPRTKERPQYTVNCTGKFGRKGADVIHCQGVNDRLTQGCEMIVVVGTYGRYPMYEVHQRFLR